jgi:hypothetical protein
VLQLAIYHVTLVRVLRLTMGAVPLHVVVHLCLWNVHAHADLVEPALARSVATNPLELVVLVQLIKVGWSLLVTLDTHSVVLVVHNVLRVVDDIFLVKQVIIVA